MQHQQQQQQQQNNDDRSAIPIAMYTCGPTVYDAAHIGNFRAFLTYDLLKRVLVYLDTRTFSMRVTLPMSMTRLSCERIASSIRTSQT